MTLSNKFNVYAPEWREIKALLNARRSDLVEKLVASDDSETRGRIKEIDNILSLDKPEEAIDSPPSQY